MIQEYVHVMLTEKVHMVNQIVSQQLSVIILMLVLLAMYYCLLPNIHQNVSNYI